MTRPDAPSSPSSPTPFSGTLLAFDFGERRLGVAVGDAGLRTAHPLAGIAAVGEARFAAIAALIAEWRPGRLVVGLPLGPDAALRPITQRAERFARQLEGRYGLPVARVDERYSSTEAEARLREAAGRKRAAKASRERKIDSYAAQLILAQYLDESAPPAGGPE